jgi:hypothetical protein
MVGGAHPTLFPENREPRTQNPRPKTKNREPGMGIRLAGGTPALPSDFGGQGPPDVVSRKSRNENSKVAEGRIQDSPLGEMVGSAHPTFFLKKGLRWGKGLVIINRLKDVAGN